MTISVEIFRFLCERAEQFKACGVFVLRLYHIVDVVFGECDVGDSPALDLELIITHRDVLFNDRIGRNMRWQVGYLIDMAEHRRAFEVLKVRWLAHHRRRFHIFRILYLCFADRTVMLASSRAVRNAAGIYEKLAFFLVRKRFEKPEIIVPIIVENDIMIVFFKLCGKVIGVSYLLAGGRGYPVARVIFANVFFEYRRHNDDLVQTVIAHSHNLIAERVAEVLFFDKRVRERESERNSS